MTGKARKEAMLGYFRKNKKAEIQELAETFEVSVITVRRDLDELEKKGFIRKVYGGAVLLENPEPYLLSQPGFASRMNIRRQQKTAIAAAAAELVNAGDVIVLDIGTTCLETAKCLKGIAELTVITTSLPVLNELSDTDITLISLGGLVRKHELALCGSITRNSLRDFCINKAIIGAGGISLERGVTTFSRDSAEVVSAIIERADEVILVTDSSKFDRNVLSVAAPLEKISTIVTDKGIPEAYIEACREKGIRLIMTDN